MRADRLLGGVALVLGLAAAAGVARAGGDDEQPAPDVNPLAPPAGWWQGTFADKEVRVTLREEEGRVAGELEAGGQRYAVRGRVDEEGQLLCAFSREGAPSWGLLISAEDGGRTLVLQSGGSTRRLDKQASDTAAGGLLDHVRPGQRYVYDMTASGMALRQIYEVVAVEGRRVKCQLRMLMQMPGETEFTEQGDPTPYDWELPPADAGAQAPEATPEVTTRREKVTLAGKEWDCMVTETQGTTVWVPMKGDQPTFPPYLKLSSPHSEASLGAILEPKK